MVSQMALLAQKWLIGTNDRNDLQRLGQDGSNIPCILFTWLIEINLATKLSTLLSFLFFFFGRFMRDTSAKLHTFSAFIPPASTQRYNITRGNAIS